MLRQRMRCDAPPFSPADYNFIMQYRDERSRSKVLYELKENIAHYKNIFIKSGEARKKIGLHGINQFICQQLRFLVSILWVSGLNQKSKAKMFLSLQNWKM